MLRDCIMIHIVALLIWVIISTGLCSLCIYYMMDYHAEYDDLRDLDEVRLPSRNLTKTLSNGNQCILEFQLKDQNFTCSISPSNDDRFFICNNESAFEYRVWYGEVHGLPYVSCKRPRLLNRYQHLVGVIFVLGFASAFLGLNCIAGIVSTIAAACEYVEAKTRQSVISNV
jgi:hypothetical protein